jgi:cytoskeleton protein RodZ
LTEQKQQKKQQLSQEEKAAQLAALGAKLKSLREAQGLTSADVASDTKIQKHYIEAMEDGRLELLPKGPYARSFLKEYCTRLSALDLWRSYDVLTADKKLVVPGVADYRSVEPEQSYSKTPRIFKNRSYAWIYAIVVISICAAVWLTWQNRGNFAQVSTSPETGGTASVAKPAPPAPAPGSPDLAPAAPAASGTAPSSSDASVDLAWMDGKPMAPKQPRQTTSADAAAVSQDTAVAGSGQLTIASSGVVWLKVTQQGKTLFEGILRNGESKDFQGGAQQLRVRYGNPGKTSATWNGQQTSPVADSSSPVTRYYKPDGSVSDKR